MSEIDLLQRQIEQLQAEVTELKCLVKKLEERIAKIEKRKPASSSEVENLKKSHSEWLERLSEQGRPLVTF
ncbi:MAG TPA: hypothetical protein VJB92_04110 [Candidatus Paceibacterota bacterium]